MDVVVVVTYTRTNVKQGKLCNQHHDNMCFILMYLFVQLPLRVLTSSFSDKGWATILDYWLRFHLQNRYYISGASFPHIILNFFDEEWFRC